jgi:hypothetical protein
MKPASAFMNAALEAEIADKLVKGQKFRYPRPIKDVGPDLPYEGLYPFLKSASRTLGDSQPVFIRGEMEGTPISMVPGIPIFSEEFLAYQLSLPELLSKAYPVEKPDEWGRYPEAGVTTKFLGLRCVSGLVQRNGGAAVPKRYEAPKQLNLPYEKTTQSLRSLAESINRGYAIPKDTTDPIETLVSKKINGWPTLVDQWVDEACAIFHNEHWMPSAHSAYLSSSPSYPLNTNNLWVSQMLVEFAFAAMDYLATLSPAEVWRSFRHLADEFGVVRAFMRWFRQQGRDVRLANELENAVVAHDVCTKKRDVVTYRSLVKWLTTGEEPELEDAGFALVTSVRNVLYGVFTLRYREFMMAGKPFSEISRLTSNATMNGSFGMYPLALHTNVSSDLELLFGRYPHLVIWDIDAQDRETTAATNDTFCGALGRYIAPGIAEFVRSGYYGSLIVTNDEGTTRNRIEGDQFGRARFSILGDALATEPEFNYGLPSGYGTVKQQGNYNGSRCDALHHRIFETGPFRGFGSSVRNMGREAVILHTLNRLKEGARWETKGYGRVSLGDNNCDGFESAAEARQYRSALKVNHQHRISLSKKIAGNVPLFKGGRLLFRNDPESYVGNEFALEHSTLGPLSPYGADGYFIRQMSYNMARKEEMHRLISDHFRKFNPYGFSLDDAMRPYRRMRDLKGIPWETQLAMAMGEKAVRLAKAGMIPLESVPLLAADTLSYPPHRVFPRIMRHLSRDAIIVDKDAADQEYKAQLKKLGLTPEYVLKAREGQLPTVAESWSEGRATR